jgi:hypothetical protein
MQITRPFAVVRYEDGFRMFVDVKVNGNLAVIGAAIKNVGKGLDEK